MKLKMFVCTYGSLPTHINVSTISTTGCRHVDKLTIFAKYTVSNQTYFKLGELEIKTVHFGIKP